MILFDYRCTCGVILEDCIVKEQRCPKCGKQMSRIYKPTPFILKGSWPGKDIKK